MIKTVLLVNFDPDGHFRYTLYKTFLGIKIKTKKKGKYTSLVQMKKDVIDSFDARLIDLLIFYDYRNLSVTTDRKDGLELLDYFDA